MACGTWVARSTVGRNTGPSKRFGPGGGVAGIMVGRHPQAICPVPARSPNAVLVTQPTSQALHPLWRNFESGGPFALLMLEVGWDAGDKHG